MQELSFTLRIWPELTNKCLCGLFCAFITGKVIWWASACQSLLRHHRQKHCRCNKCRGLYRYWPWYVSLIDLIFPFSAAWLDVNWWIFCVFACVDTLCAVLERDTLSIRENRLFGAVVRWAEAECYRQQLPPTSENKQKVLGKALPLIRFPLMTVEEFAAGKGIIKNTTCSPCCNVCLFFQHHTDQFNH